MVDPVLLTKTFPLLQHHAARRSQHQSFWHFGSLEQPNLRRVSWALGSLGRNVEVAPDLLSSSLDPHLQVCGLLRGGRAYAQCLSAGGAVNLCPLRSCPSTSTSKAGQPASHSITPRSPPRRVTSRCRTSSRGPLPSPSTASEDPAHKAHRGYPLFSLAHSFGVSLCGLAELKASSNENCKHQSTPGHPSPSVGSRS